MTWTENFLSLTLRNERECTWGWEKSSFSCIESNEILSFSGWAFSFFSFVHDVFKKLGGLEGWDDSLVKEKVRNVKIHQIGFFILIT